MRTTVDIQDNIIKEIIRVTRAKSKTEAINKALEQFVKIARMGEIKSLFGKVKISNNWQRLEEREIQEMKNERRYR